MKEAALRFDGGPLVTEREADRTPPPEEPAARLDLRSAPCGRALARAMTALERLPAGAVLEVRLRDDGEADGLARRLALVGHVPSGRRTGMIETVMWVRRGG